MKVMIPIPNLIIENVMQLGDITLIPHEYFMLYERQELEYDELTFNNSAKSEIESVMNLCIKEYYKEHFNKTAVALFEHNISIQEYSTPIAIEEFALLEKLCDKVDRALDFIRLNYCNICNKEELPGIPGILDGYRRGIFINLSDKTCRAILGNVCNIYYQPGIGAYPYVSSPINDSPNMYSYLFSERQDPVYQNCRAAFIRINEAMYMNNLNSAFIYLISTLEMLANAKTNGFSACKPLLLPFLATSKANYHNLSEELRNISEDIRTPIVHNGKSLYNLIPPIHPDEIKNLLGRLTMHIVNYCTEVIDTGITSFDELALERTERKKALGIC